MTRGLASFAEVRQSAPSSAFGMDRTPSIGRVRRAFTMPTRQTRRNCESVGFSPRFGSRPSTDSANSAKRRVDGVDRLLAVGGGLVGGALAIVAIWLAYRLGPTQIHRVAQMAASWHHHVGGRKILAQNRSGVDHGTGT